MIYIFEWYSNLAWFQITSSCYNGWLSGLKCIGGVLLKFMVDKDIEIRFYIVFLSINRLIS